MLEGKKTTLRDVAKAAGVSPGVVSSVLSGKHRGVIRVTDSTRARIHAAARALDYRPNLLARSLRSGRTQTLLLALYFLDPLAPHGFLSRVLAGILSACTQRGYDLTIHKVTKRDEAKPALLGDGRADGVIWLAPELDDAALSHASGPGIPFVALCAKLANGGRCVAADNKGAILTAVDHLAALGHREFLFVRSSNCHLIHDGREREDGFRNAIALRGLSGSVAILDQVASRLRDPDRRPTALIGWNDDTAIAAMEVAQGVGRSVPGDLSVVGFDSHFQCENTQPPLTSLYQPLGEMAEMAVALVIGSIEEHGAPELGARQDVHIFGCRLDVRDSTGPGPHFRGRCCSGLPSTSSPKERI